MTKSTRFMLAGTVLLGAALIAGAVAPAPPVLAQQGGSVAPKVIEPKVIEAHRVAVTPPVREIQAIQAQQQTTPPGGGGQDRARENPPIRRSEIWPGRLEADSVVQLFGPAANMGAPLLTFDGFTATDNTFVHGFTVNPPDTDGDVGPNHYVAIVNLVWGVYAKNGVRLVAPLKLSQLWSSAGFTDKCATNDDGDPIVLYDEYADRWILSQFAFGNSAPYYECVAVSQSPDPTGRWYVYSFQVPNSEFPDYPKLGVWPDAYYMTVNQFTNLGPFNGTGAYAFERERMLRGDPAARLIYFNLNLTSFPEAIGGGLPSDADGLLPPPPGTPNIFAYFTAAEFGDPADGLRLFDFHVDWANPAASTFTERPESTYAAPLPVAPFNPLSPLGREDVIQPNGEGVDAIPDRLMHRMQYRNFGTHQSLVTNHTVNVSGGGTLGTYRAGVRYYELRKTGAGNFVVQEQGTFAPADGQSRWMGSAAMDASGNLAVGYSSSGPGEVQFPSIAYAGRLASDPPGGLFQGEARMFSGLGSQAGSANRWGDYTAMAVDPTDECTFWYTNEYHPAGSTTFNWRTRIGKFDFGPGTCTRPARGTARINVSECAGGAGLGGVAIYIGGTLYGTTSQTGSFHVQLPPGTYPVEARYPGMGPAFGTLVVAPGGEATLNLCLVLVPEIVETASSLSVESCPPANGAVDPAERVTYALTLSNVGPVPTRNLVGTLQAGPNVSAPSAPQAYGVIRPGESATRTFSWTGVGTCGSPWTAAFAVADGAITFPGVAITGTYGATATTTLLAEYFDAVTAPALPGGWSAFNGVEGDGILWKTSTTMPDTPPNAAFVNDPSVVSDKWLDMPAVAFPVGNFQLKFRHRFDLESGFDGGVLEASVDGGAFQDIIAAGGSFLAGGYTHTISTSFGSPIAARQAWSSRSGGGATPEYIDTAVALPASFGGHNVGFRFRMASDNSVARTGWWVDTLRLESLERVCAQNCATVRLITRTVLSRLGPDVQAAITVTNTGSSTANNVALTSALLGARAGAPLPQSLGNVPAGGSVTAVVRFPAVAPGANTLRVDGRYTGGTFTSTIRVSVP